MVKVNLKLWMVAVILCLAVSSHAIRLPINSKLNRQELGSSESTESTDATENKLGSGPLPSRNRLTGAPVPPEEAETEKASHGLDSTEGESSSSSTTHPNTKSDAVSSADVSGESSSSSTTHPNTKSDAVSSTDSTQSANIGAGPVPYVSEDGTQLTPEEATEEGITTSTTTSSIDTTSDAVVATSSSSSSSLSTGSWIAIAFAVCLVVSGLVAGGYILLKRRASSESTSTENNYSPL